MHLHSAKKAFYYAPHLSTDGNPGAQFTAVNLIALLGDVVRA